MSPVFRVRLIGTSVVVTVIYSLLIVIDTDLAQSLMLGYCGLILTIFLFDHFSRRHDDPKSKGG